MRALPRAKPAQEAADMSEQTTAERVPGFYWVRRKIDGVEWVVARWVAWRGWLTAGWHGVYQDSDFAEVDERRIERDEQS